MGVCFPYHTCLPIGNPVSHFSYSFVLRLLSHNEAGDLIGNVRDFVHGTPNCNKAFLQASIQGFFVLEATICV